MAELPIGGLQILTNRGSGVDAGDKIEILWDDVAEEIVVYHNDVSAVTVTLITSGPNLGLWGTDYVDYVYFTRFYYNGRPVSLLSIYSFCNSTTLNQFIFTPVDYASFPYVYQHEVENSGTCSTGGIACDILYTSPPILVNPTIQTGATGGSITVSATSSHGTVKYSLADFDYATEGQTSGTFSDLPPGDYTVWAKDTYGCYDVVTLTLTLEIAHVEHFLINYDDTFGNKDCRIRIYERGYIGDTIELTYSGAIPLSIVKPSGDLNDKFQVVNPIKAIVNLQSLVDFEFLNLYTQDDKKYKVVHEIDTGSGFEVNFAGYIAPSIYAEPYKAPPYESVFEAGDGLARLGDEPFTDQNGNKLSGRNSIIKTIAFILSKTGLGLDIKCGVNVFETNHNQTASDDPFEQTFVDHTCYRNADGTPFNCKDVLEAILKPFGARIKQAGGVWSITRFEEETVPYAYRVFDSSGDYVSNSTFDPVVSIKNPDETDRVASLNSPILEIIPAYGEFRVKTIFNQVGTLVTGSFEKEDLLNTDDDTSGFKDWTLNLNSVDGVAFIRNVLPDKTSAGAFQLATSSGQPRDAYIQSKTYNLEYGPGDKLRMSFNYGLDKISSSVPFIVLNIEIKVGSDYMQLDGTWDSAVSTFRVYPAVPPKLEKYETTFDLPEVSVLTDTTIAIKIYAYFSGHADFSDNTLDNLADFKAFTTTDKIYYKTDVLRYDVGLGVQYIDYYDLVIATESESDPSVIRPDDYNVISNPKNWKHVVRVSKTGITHNSKFIIDNIDIDILIAGVEPPSEQVYTFGNDPNISETIDVELFNCDLPTVQFLDDVYINNGKNNYNNYFSLEDGTPTGLWTRPGIIESMTIQRLFMKMLVAQYTNPTFKLSGGFVSDLPDIVLSADNTLEIFRPADTVSLVNGDFASGSTGWTQVGSGTSFTFSGGKALITLSGAASNSKQLQQPIVISDVSNLQVTIDMERTSATVTDREDRIYAVFYNVDGNIIQSDIVRTLLPSSGVSSELIVKKIFVPRSAYYFALQIVNVAGSTSVDYEIDEITLDGLDVTEVYQITGMEDNEKECVYNLVLSLISGSNTALGGGTVVIGAGAYSDAYSDAYNN